MRNNTLQWCTKKTWTCTCSLAVPAIRLFLCSIKEIRASFAKSSGVAVDLSCTQYSHFHKSGGSCITHTSQVRICMWFSLFTHICGVHCLQTPCAFNMGGHPTRCRKCMITHQPHYHNCLLWHAMAGRQSGFYPSTAIMKNLFCLGGRPTQVPSLLGPIEPTWLHDRPVLSASRF